MSNNRQNILVVKWASAAPALYAAGRGFGAGSNTILNRAFPRRGSAIRNMQFYLLHNSFPSLLNQLECYSQTLSGVVHTSDASTGATAS